MLKYLTSSVLAAAVALGTVQSANAGSLDSGELGRLLLGIGAVAVISSQLDSQKRKTTPTTRRYVDDRDYYRPRVSFRDAKRACKRNDGYGNTFISARCMNSYGF